MAEGGPEGGAEAGPTTPLVVLIRVQDLDTAISQLRHRRDTLPERQELRATEARLADLGARATEQEDRRRDLQARQAELEGQIAALAGRRKSLENRMYADRGSSARDLQAMDEEIRHLADRRSELEDVELELMEEQEPVDAELSRLAEEQGQLRSSADRLRASVAEAEAVVDADLSAETAARAELAIELPPDLAARYETLRTHLSGVGAARLIGSHCDGCHLELASVEVERVRRLPPGSVATCDQCGRILVRA